MSGIDRDIFDVLKERMKAKFPILLEGFLRDAKAYLSSVENNASGDNLNELIDAAHSLKSASGLLGITAVFRAAEKVEYTAKGLQEDNSTDYSSLSVLVQELLGAFNEVENDLEQELEKVKSA